MNPPVKNQLTPEQSAEYAGLKTTVRNGMLNYVETGLALLRISDERYYIEDGYATFKEFVRAEYSMSVSRAYRLCEAAEIIKTLPIGQQPQIKNERQARAVAVAPEEKREKVLETAKEHAEEAGEKLSSSHIEQAVLEVCPESKEKKQIKRMAKNFNPMPDIGALQAFTTLVDDAMALTKKENPLLPFQRVLEERAAKLQRRDQEMKDRKAYA